ncbi:sulfur carrier protein ThiS [Microbulbifer halophilus]|uniref:Sulfur carrier protein ThiS n=1 Tax=Microbulbifer halophilus TaxID=453963 RepID=A0ABW5ECE7_9GAMM|nr:sulfur carrier protein ThiS [Microbulbifer halophilus]MCW8126514.1 sulfur carrier protein ThiS [Microbulbifer halophilus]
MEIQVNGESRRAERNDLPGLLRELGYSGETFAVAVNGDFVPRAQYPDTRIAEGDHLDVVAPVVGG